MFYNWVYPLHDYFQGFELIKYISFRAGLAAITAFLISVLIGAKITKILKKHKVSEDTTKTDSKTLKDLHKDKKRRAYNGWYYYFDSDSYFYFALV